MQVHVFAVIQKIGRPKQRWQT